MTNHQVLRIAAGGELLGRLSCRQVHLRLAGPFESPNPDVADDADDGTSTPLVSERPADRILTGPVVLGERRADDRDPGAIATVALFHVAAAVKRNPHGPEVLGGHPSVTDAFGAIALRLPAGDLHRGDD